MPRTAASSTPPSYNPLAAGPYCPSAFLMNLVAPLLDSQSVLINQAFTSKRKFFEHAAARVESCRGLKAAAILDNLLERERLGSTALGQGVAIPHGRLKGLSGATGMFYRLNPPLDFDAPDERPVALCFVLLVPMDADEHHLQILGELAQMLGDETLRRRLLNAPGAEDIYRIIAAWTP